MKYKLNALKEDVPYFTTQLNAIIAGIAAQGLCTFTITTELSKNYTDRVTQFDFYMPPNEQPVISSLGDIIRDWMMEKMDHSAGHFPSLVFNFKINQGDEVVFDKSFRILAHFGSPHLLAENVLNRKLLMDQKVMLIPYEGNNVVQPQIFAYLPQSDLILARFYMDPTRWLQPNSYSSFDNVYGDSNISYIFESFSAFKSYNATEFFVDVMTQSEYSYLQRSKQFNFNSGLQLILKENYGGVSFLFINSYGLPEYMFIPGSLSQKVEKNSSLVVTPGNLSDVDIEVETTYSLKVSAAPSWLVDNVKALLNSRAVTWLEDKIPSGFYPFVSLDSNVSIIEMSGTLAEDPQKLSDFTISFKRTDI